MKIGIDISQIIYETGVSWYTKKLVENLLSLDKENEYILFGGSMRRLNDLKAKVSSFSGNYNYTTKFLPIAPTLSDLVWNRLHLFNIENLIGNVDVFHSSDWSQPPSHAFKVTTVHDLWPIKFPSQTHPRVVATHKARLYWVKKEVDKIIVPSISTKNDLLDLGFNEKKIKVIHEGPHLQDIPDEKKIKETLKKYNLKKKFLLGVGVSARKNTDRIIRAFELATAGKDYDLVLVGRQNTRVEKTKGVRVLGHVGDEDLPALYSSSEALVYPSLYEGFGLPIIDAFNLDCPVITSNTSSMPEVAGQGAILVDPLKIESIADGIKYAITHKKTLIQKGKKEVERFSWTKAAFETLAVYKESSK
ncbi:MAG: glycosyltransferase family 1 protein [Patescibacteria group bacterium]